MSAPSFERTWYDYKLSVPRNFSRMYWIPTWILLLGSLVAVILLNITCCSKSYKFLQFFLMFAVISYQIVASAKALPLISTKNSASLPTLNKLRHFKTLFSVRKPFDTNDLTWNFPFRRRTQNTDSCVKSEHMWTKYLYCVKLPC